MPTTLNIHESSSRLLLSHGERKAQGTIAISATFITSIILSFKIFSDAQFSIWIILILSLLILIFVVARSMSALRVNLYHGIEDLENINAIKVKALEQSQTWLLHAIYTICARITLLKIPVHVCTCVDNLQCSVIKNDKKNKPIYPRAKGHKRSKSNIKPSDKKHY